MFKSVCGIGAIRGLLFLQGSALLAGLTRPGDVMHHASHENFYRERSAIFFPRIAKWLQAGESVEVTYRGKKLAKLIPASPTAPPPRHLRILKLD
jgi:hypothetical protein